MINIKGGKKELISIDVTEDTEEITGSREIKVLVKLLVSMFIQKNHSFHIIAYYKTKSRYGKGGYGLRSKSSNFIKSTVMGEIFPCPSSFSISAITCSVLQYVGQAKTSRFVSIFSKARSVMPISRPAMTALNSTITFPVLDTLSILCHSLFLKIENLVTERQWL